MLFKKVRLGQKDTKNIKALFCGHELGLNPSTEHDYDYAGKNARLIN